MKLYFIKRSDGQWVNKSYKRLSDAKNKITRQARYYKCYRNATIYEIELNDETAKPVLTAEHEITCETIIGYNDVAREYERVETTYREPDNTNTVNSTEDLSQI